MITKQSADEMAQAYLSDPWITWTGASVGLTWVQQGHTTRDLQGSYTHMFKCLWSESPPDLAQSLARCEAYAKSMVESGEWVEFEIYLTD